MTDNNLIRDLEACSAYSDDLYQRAADRLKALTGNARVTDIRSELIALAEKGGPLFIEDIEDYFAALPSGVRVKPLEWNPTHNVGWLRAEAIGKAYEVREGQPDTESKIAAAQADHERRILSAIEPTRAPQPGPEAASGEVQNRPERLWLSAPDDDHEHQIWFDPDEGGTEYVRADLYTVASGHQVELVAFPGIDGQVLTDIAQRGEDDEYQNSPAWLWFGDDLTTFGRWNKGDQVAYIRGDIATVTLDAAQSALAERDAEIERLQAENARWRQNGRETFEAMCAMRNAINEHIPMPSLDSDLLSGPENSVFCSKVAEAVIARIAELEKVLEPFADISDLVDAETEGVSEDDEFQLLFHDYLLASWKLSLFRRARAALHPDQGAQS